MCQKICYDKRGAQGELNLINKAKRRYRRKSKNRREVRYYHCPECNAYHLTSQEYREEPIKDFVDKDTFFNQLKQVIEIAQ